MMDPSETNSFEEQWKKAFQEASEMPPLSAWEGIEARLDKEESKVVPLWWQTPRLWYAAASVAALLMVGVALWNGALPETNQEIASSRTQADDRLMKANESDAQVEGKAVQPVEEDIKVPSSRSETVIAGNKPGLEKGIPAVQSSGIKSDQLATVAQGESSRAFAKTNNPKVLPEEKENAVATTLHTEDNKVLITGRGSENVAVASLAPKGVAEVPMDKPAMDAAGQIMAEALTPIGYKDLDIYMQKRYVFFKPDVPDLRAEKTAKKRKEYYAGVGLMPASFNPNVKVTSAPSAFAYANASSRSKVGESHAGTSYALQTQGGKRISKHWSVETGVSYLQGNSSYEGGGYLIDAATSRSQNVLESGIADKNAANQGYQGMVGAAPPSSNALYIDLNKEVRNNYRYLQVPLQAGFTLNPDKKLSYSLLGGMMANFFMNNEIESASGSVITTKASDDVYRSLNWAATTGLRLNYRLSPQWRAMMTGSYQQSLTSGFKNSETLEAHPYLYGVSWGVRYSF